MVIQKTLHCERWNKDICKPATLMMEFTTSRLDVCNKKFVGVFGVSKHYFDPFSDSHSLVCLDQ